MRQTIECEACAQYQKAPKRRYKDQHPDEKVEQFQGFPIRYIWCDACGVEMSVNQLVVAIGVWVEGRIPNIPDWHLQYIRIPHEGEIRRYRLAATSAKELRNDPA